MNDQSQEAATHREIPVSAGTPMEVKVLLVLALVIVFMQGAFVIGASGFGKVWPAENSVKIPLPPGI